MPVFEWGCKCLNPKVQVGETTNELDETDLTWHQLGCHVRKRVAAMAFITAMTDAETLQGPRAIPNGISEQQLDDLYRMVRWFADVMDTYRTKEAQYGRTWRDAGWAGQVYQIYRRARRLMVMGWWSYDEAEFDKESADQNAGDLVAHAYFLYRLLQDSNRTGHP
jgi:hypothetical protein